MNFNVSGQSGESRKWGGALGPHFYFYFFCACFWFIPGSAQEFLLALHLGSLSTVLWGTHVMLGIKLGWLQSRQLPYSMCSLQPLPSIISAVAPCSPENSWLFSSLLSLLPSRIFGCERHLPSFLSYAFGWSSLNLRCFSHKSYDLAVCLSAISYGQDNSE